MELELRVLGGCGGAGGGCAAQSARVDDEAEAGGVGGDGGECGSVEGGECCEGRADSREVVMNDGLRTVMLYLWVGVESFFSGNFRVEVS